MATIELNERSHQLIHSMRDLRTKLLLDDDGGGGGNDSDDSADSTDERTASSAPAPNLARNLLELERGLDDAEFLALVSDYLTGLRRQHSQLHMEHELLRHELEYVRGQLVAALEHTADGEEAADRRRAAANEAADPLGVELSFDSRCDAEIFGSDVDVEECPELVDSDDPDEFILIIEDDNSAAPADSNRLSDSCSTVASQPQPPPPPSSPRQIANATTTATTTTSGPVPHRTRLLSQHFAAYLNAGDYDVAAPVCQRMLSDLSSTSSCLSSTDSSSADSARDLAAALEVLALADRAHGRFADAAARQRAALDIYERCVPAGHAAHIAALNTLAHLYGKCGQPERARPLCALALQLRRAVCGARDRSVGRQHYNAAVVEQQCGALDAALQHYRCALDIYAATHTVAVDGGRAAADADGEQKVAQMTDTIRERMAGILVQLGRLPEAAGVYKEWLAPTTRQRVQQQQQQQQRRLSLGGGGGSAAKTMRPIWEVAEEIERMCTTAGAGRQRSLESYELRCDYRQWYDSVRVHFPGACAALKRLAFVYRRMGMHYAAKMLEHCCTLQRRKRTLRFDGGGGKQQQDGGGGAMERLAGGNKENVVPN